MGFKMVRDGQPEFSREHGVSGTWRESPDPIASLRKKLGEELGEYCEDHDPGELYDLLDVLDELICLSDPDGSHAMKHAAKSNAMGFFAMHVEWSPVPGG